MKNPFSDGLSVKIDSDTSGLTDGLDSATSKLGDMKTAVAGAGAALAGLAAGAMAKSVQAASRFEAQMADVEKVTNADMVAPLKNGIQDLATEIPIAQGKLATLAEQAGKFGAESETEIMSFVESVGKISSATDLAAQEAGTRFAKIAGAVGMPMKEIDKLGNAVNALADSFKTDAGEITDTATRASNVLAQQLGLGEDAVLALSATMNEVSSSSRLAASSLKRAANSLMDPKKVADVAGALGMQVDEFKKMREENPEKLMKLVAKQMAEGGKTATQLRGILGKAATDFSKLGTQMDATSEAQKTVNQQFKNGTSLQKEMEIRTNTFSGQVQLLKNQLRNVAIAIGDELLPYLKDMLSILTRGVSRVSAFIQANEHAATVAKALAAILGGGLVVALGGAVSTLGVYSTAATAATGATSALTAALGLLTAPVLAVVAALAALAIAYETNLFGFKDAVDQVVGVAVDRFGELVGWIEGKIPPALAALRRGFEQTQQVIQQVIDVIRPFVEETLQRLTAIWAQHGDDVRREIDETMQHVRSVVQDVMAWLQPHIETVLRAIQAFWTQWGDDILAGVDATFSAIQTVIEFTLDAIRGTLEFALDAILTAIRVTLNLIQGDWKAAWDLIAGFFERTLNGILSFAETWGERFLSWLGGVIDDAIQWFRDLATKLIGGSIIPEMLDAIHSAFESRWTDVKDTIASIFGEILGQVDTWLGNVESTIHNAIGSITSWLSGSGASKFFNAFDSMAQSAVDAFNSLMPSSLDLPTVNIGTQSVGIPSINVAGETIGGGSLTGVPDISTGTRTLDLPQLDTGGLIEESGLAMLHAGEMVVPKADVDRSASGGATVIVKNNEFTGVENAEDAGAAIYKEVASKL